MISFQLQFVYFIYISPDKTFKSIRVAKSSTAKFKNFGSHRSVTNKVFEGVECGENVRYKWPDR